MADVRRVEFQTLSAHKEPKSEKKVKLSTRFNLALAESTASTCPEYSFTELMKKVKGTSESEASFSRDPDDPFGGEDEALHNEVAALARKFEEKYSQNKPGKKKKMKCADDDYYDMGDGYDSDDPFIDNTEAYDEVVPSYLTTKHGGFYINRGELDFREKSDIDDSEAEFVTPVVKKRGRPRKILDSDEEEETGPDGEPKKKKKRRRLKDDGDGEKGEKKKRKKLVGPDGVENGKKKKEKKKMSSTVKELLKQQTASTAKGSSENSLADENSYQGSPFNQHGGTIQERIDAMINESMEEGEDGKANGTEGAQQELPTDLPAALKSAVADIKKAAYDSKEGKCKFFTNHVNKLLLDIELGSRQIAQSKRSAIYAHLACHLPCGKETLIKRAKKLRENQQDDQLKQPIEKLKKEIDKVMPGLQAQHELEVAKARQELKEKEEQGQKEEVAPPNTESDDEEKTDNKGRKGNRDPRKKFKWTPEIKVLLHQIVNVKMHMYDTYKFRNQTPEEYVKAFLENEIKVLWPQGWIQTRMLYKETRSVHGKWTNLGLKTAKRPALQGQPAASPTPVSLSATTATDTTDSKPVASARNTTEVIEIDSDDHPSPPPNIGSKVSDNSTQKVRANDSSRLSDSLKFSPQTMESLAASTAAMIAAAVSPRGDFFPTRPKAEAPKRLDISGAASASGFQKSSPPSSQPKTPPVSAREPFLAEFSRYINSNSNSASSLSQVSMQGLSTQLQNTTVSSSSIADRKAIQQQQQQQQERKSQQHQQQQQQQNRKAQQQQQKALSQAEVQRQLEEQRMRVETQRMAQAQATAFAAAAAQFALANAGSDFASPQQYQKMAAMLMAQDSQDSNSARSKLVQEQLLSKIQAELDASKSRSSPSASGNSKPGTKPGSKPGMSGARSVVGNSKPGGASKQAVKQANVTQPSRTNFVASNATKPSPPPAHSTAAQSAVPNSALSMSATTPAHTGSASLPPRQLPAASSRPATQQRQSPVTIPSRQSPTVSSKQQAVVPPRTVPGSELQGQRSSPATTLSQPRTVGRTPSPAVMTGRTPSPANAGRVQSAGGPSSVHADPAHRIMSAPTPNTTNLNATPSAAHATQPFQRNSSPSLTPTTALTATRPMPAKVSPAHSQQALKVMQGQVTKVSPGQGQGAKGVPGQRMKALPGQGTKMMQGQGVKVMPGQGQGVKVTSGQSQLSPQHMRISAGIQQQRQAAASNAQQPQTQGNMQQQQLAAKAAIKLMTQQAVVTTASSVARNQSVNQSILQQIEMELKQSTAAASSVTNSRPNPVPQKPSISQQASSQVPGSILNQGSNPNSAHSKPPAFPNMNMAGVPRPQEPNAAGLAAYKAPITTGVTNMQSQSPIPKSQGVVASGLFNHRPAFHPLQSIIAAALHNKDGQRPPQNSGQ